MPTTPETMARSSQLKKGPRGGVYYVARSGARVYVERSAYTSGNFGPNSARSRLLSVNPGDKEHKGYGSGAPGSGGGSGALVFGAVFALAVLWQIL